MTAPWGEMGVERWPLSVLSVQKRDTTPSSFFVIIEQQREELHLSSIKKGNPPPPFFFPSVQPFDLKPTRMKKIKTKCCCPMRNQVYWPVTG